MSKRKIDDICETLHNQKCPICLEVLNNVVETDLCGHLFCKECIVKYVEQSNEILKCPTCKTVLDKETNWFHTSHAWTRTFNSVKRQCHFEECEFTGNKKEMGCHLDNDCLFVPIECVCNKKLLKGDFHNHQEMECLNYKIKCELCNIFVIRKKLIDKTHIENDCPMVDLVCQNNKCDHKCLRKDIKEHNDICQHAQILCMYECNTSYIRKDKEAHEQDCTYYPEPCQHCKKNIIRVSKDDHEKMCDNRPVICPVCSADIIYSNMNNHIDNECEHSVRKCKYYMAGCKFEDSMDKMKEHEQENKDNHLKLLYDIVNKEYRVGNMIDVMDTKNYSWEPAIITAVCMNTIHIRYTRWSNKYNESIHKESSRIAQHMSNTCVKILDVWYNSEWIKIKFDTKLERDVTHVQFFGTDNDIHVKNIRTPSVRHLFKENVSIHCLKCDRAHIITYVYKNSVIVNDCDDNVYNRVLYKNIKIFRDVIGNQYFN